MDHRLRDLRADARDNAIRAHQPRGGHGLEQVLGNQGVHGRHAGDVDDGDLRTGLDDALEQRFHDDAGAVAVQGADERQGHDAVPDLDHRGGKFEHVLLLAGDHFLAGLLVDLRGVQGELVEQPAHFPGFVEQALGRAGFLAQAERQRLLEREDERRRLARREAHPAAVAGKLVEHLQGRFPGRGLDVGDVAGVQSFFEALEELGGLLAQLVLLDQVTPHRFGSELGLHPGGEQVLVRFLDQLGDAAGAHRSGGGVARGEPSIWAVGVTYYLLAGATAGRSWKGGGVQSREPPTASISNPSKDGR